MRYSSSDSSDVETDKLKVTVLSFNNIQFTNDDIDSDDEDADHNNVNYMKFRRIRSVDVGIRPVPSRHETVRAITQPSSTSYLYPSSEGYVAVSYTHLTLPTKA